MTTTAFGCACDSCRLGIASRCAGRTEVTVEEVEVVAEREAWWLRLDVRGAEERRWGWFHKRAEDRVCVLELVVWQRASWRHRRLFQGAGIAANYFGGQERRLLGAGGWTTTRPGLPYSCRTCIKKKKWESHSETGMLILSPSNLFKQSINPYCMTHEIHIGDELEPRRSITAPTSITSYSSFLRVFRANRESQGTKLMQASTLVFVQETMVQLPSFMQIWECVKVYNEWGD